MDLSGIDEVPSREHSFIDGSQDEKDKEMEAMVDKSDNSMHILGIPDERILFATAQDEYQESDEADDKGFTASFNKEDGLAEFIFETDNSYPRAMCRPPKPIEGI